MSLPREMYLEIGKHLPLSSQPRYHQISRMFRNLPFNPTDCCVEPTNSEIANWLYDQSRLLSNEHTKQYSVFKPFRDYMRFSFGPNERYQIYLLYDGQLEGPTSNGIRPLNSVKDILGLIGSNGLYLWPKGNMGVPLSYQANENWLVIRDIFSKRPICRTQNVSSEWCFIQFIISQIEVEGDGLKDWFRSVFVLGSFLNPAIKKRLETEFSQAFIAPLVFPLEPGAYGNFFIQNSIIPFNSTPQQIKLWLTQWFSQVTPADLAVDPRIDYRNTHYS